MNGTLALVGGREWTEGCTFDADLVAGASEVLVLPSALAYENPDEAIERARAWFARYDVGVRVLDVYRRADALESAPADIAAAARR
jgi:cyanophycinase